VEFAQTPRWDVARRPVEFHTRKRRAPQNVSLLVHKTLFTEWHLKNLISNRYKIASQMNKALAYEKVFAEVTTSVSITLTGRWKKMFQPTRTCWSVAREVLSSGFEERVAKPLKSTLLRNWRDFLFKLLLFLFLKKTNFNLLCSKKQVIERVSETSSTACYNIRYTLSCRLHVLFRFYINLLRYKITKVRK